VTYFSLGAAMSTWEWFNLAAIGMSLFFAALCLFAILAIALA
jgi:hypothetical protein